MIKRLLTVVGVALLGTVAATAQDFFEARNYAMGGTGVASSRYHAAGFCNPALLAMFEENDDFAFILPVLGAQATDPDDLRGDLDDFKDAYDELDAALNGGTPTAAMRTNLINSLNAMNNKRVFGNLGGGLAIALPRSGIAMSLVGRNYTDLNASVNIDSGDIARINTATTPTDLDNLTSKAVVVGAAVTEVGLAMAYKFELGSMALSVGVLPKFRRVITYNYAIHARDFDDDDVMDDWDDSLYREEEDDFNVDLGLALQPVEGLMLGLRAYDLIDQDYDTVITDSRSYAFSLAPRVTVGAAYRAEMVTLAVDADLVKAKRFDLDDETQLVRAGLEIDLWHWLQLRGGYRHDLEDNIDDQVTAGVGISPFDLLHIDVAGMIGVEENTWGGVVQVSFTF